MALTDAVGMQIRTDDAAAQSEARVPVAPEHSRCGRRRSYAFLGMVTGVQKSGELSAGGAVEER